MEIARYFDKLTDPRDTTKITHLLSDIIGLTVLGVIANCESYDDIEDFGNEKIDWLKQHLKLENGIPSHDTIQRVFESINPKEFSLSFSAWACAVFDCSAELFLHIDGKSNRRSYDTFKDKKMLHSVSVFAGKNKLSLAQYKVDEKSNEITAIVPLLETLDIEGQTITIDAMGCQKKIAQYINEQKAFYVLALKDNQKELHQQVKDAFENTIITESASGLEKNKGRIEERTTKVITDLRFIDESINWAAMCAIICVISKVTVKGKTTTDTRYFISNKNDKASFFLDAIRSHWGIENCLHWVLDVVFNEDYCRKRKENAAENFNIIRKIALNIIRYKKNDKKLSIRRARLKASWSNDYLDSLFKK